MLPPIQPALTPSEAREEFLLRAAGMDWSPEYQEYAREAVERFRLLPFVGTGMNLADGDFLGATFSLVGDVLIVVPIVRGLAATTNTARASATVVSRVGQLRAAIPAAQQGRITMAAAVVEDANGVRSVLIGTSEAGGQLRGPVRAIIQQGETIVSGTGHAEVNIINHAAANNLRIISIGATRPICLPCQGAIGPTGGQISTPFRATIGRGAIPPLVN